MSPPAEPLQDSVQVIFIDFPAAIEISANFAPLTTSYPTFLSLLCTLSGSFVHKLDNLPQQYVQGQGFTLSDGGWWYRLVKPASSSLGEATSDQTMLEKGPWILLDCLYGYEKLVGELCLGVKWSGARVEVQHNLQKVRDEARINKAQGTGTNDDIVQQAKLQHYLAMESVYAERNFTVQWHSRENTGAYESESTVKDAPRSGHDARMTSQELHGSEGVVQDEDGIIVGEGPGPSVDESNNAGKCCTSFAGPLVVSSPVVGIVPSDDDDESDNCTPTHNFSTPVIKAEPELSHPSIASPKSKLVKGPAGITYLPVYQAQPDHAQLPSEIGFGSKSVNRPAADPEPTFYPPPPRATGSPNDKYRQVPRSGGAVRNPNHQPYKYRYGGPGQLLIGRCLPSAYNQQQSIGQSQYNSPADAFNQDGNFFNHSQRSDVRQRQPFEQQFSPGGSYRGRSRGKYDVRKIRGEYEKRNESNRYGNRKQNQSGGRPPSSSKGQSFPLDPALEANYRNFSHQNSQSSGQDHYLIQKHAENHNQKRYTATPQFGYNYGYGDRYGNYSANEIGYQHALLAPLAFNNTSKYHAPSAFTTLEQGVIPSYSPGVGMMPPPQTAVPPSQVQQRQPFVPSPFAATFTPRFSNIHNEAEELSQHQDYPVADEAEPFQQQLYPGMLPLTPIPFGDGIPLPMPTAADLVNRVAHLSRYEKPKPNFSMPPMGDFSPPKARKNGRQAKKALEKLLAGSKSDIPGLIEAAAASNAFNSEEDNENAIVGPSTRVDKLDDEDNDRENGDSEYIPKNEGQKKNKKFKERKSRRGSSFDMKDEAKAVELRGVGQGETHCVARAWVESEAQVEVEEDEKMAEG